MAPHGVFPTRQPDRWLTLAVDSDAGWQALLAVLAKDAEYSRDQRFASAAARLANRAALESMLIEWLASADADSTAHRLQLAGVAAHVSWTARDIADDPHLRQRGSVVEVTASDGQTRAAVGAPARFSRSDGLGLRRSTPGLGQDEDYVFGELLGLSSAQRRDLESQEVIY